MPGLLRGVARTAVIAGTATAVSNRVSRRQASRWSQQDDPYGQQQYQQQYQEPPPPPPPAAAPAPDPIAQLKQLAALPDRRRRQERRPAVHASQMARRDRGPSRSLRRRPIVRPESDAAVSTWASADISTTAVRP